VLRHGPAVPVSVYVVSHVDCCTGMRVCTKASAPMALTYQVAHILCVVLATGWRWLFMAI
jgi:hypothetical protein